MADEVLEKRIKRLEMGRADKSHTHTEAYLGLDNATHSNANDLSAQQKLDLTNGGATTLHSHAGGSGDMTKAVYDPNDDGKIATGQIDMAAIYLLIYPIGCIYESVISTSPATLFGGTWATLGAGRVLVGIDAADPDFDTVEETGGAKTINLAHTHNAHTAGRKGGTTNPQDIFNAPATHASNLSATQGILPPYLVSYRWKRTA